MLCYFFVRCNVICSKVITGGDVDPLHRFVSVLVIVSFCPPNDEIIINAFEISITALISQSKGCPRMMSQSSSATIRNTASYAYDPILILVLM